MKKLIFNQSRKNIFSSLLLLMISISLFSQDFSISPTVATLKEGSTMKIVLSKNLTGITFNKDLELTINMGSISIITFTADATKLEIPITVPNDNILFNEEHIEVKIKDINNSSGIPAIYTTAITTIDATASNITKVITIGNGIIDYNGSTVITASLPDMINSISPITIALTAHSDGALQSKEVPSVITIPPNTNSITFTVSASYLAGPNQQDPIHITITGNHVDFSIRNGIVTVLGDKLNLIPAVSPNGDRWNEYLTISKIANYPTNTIYIFDERGIKVWEKSNYNNDPKVSFHGIGNTSGFDTDKLLPGIYYYYVKFEDNNPSTANPVPMNDKGFGYFKLSY